MLNKTVDILSIIRVIFPLPIGDSFIESLEANTLHRKRSCSILLLGKNEDK